MLKSDVISYYGNTVKVAMVLGISQSSVTQWREIIPEKRAVRIERLTQGKLEYRPELYEPGTAVSCDTKSV